MARGRITQMRLHAVQQASLVWGMFSGLQAEQLGQFVQTGTMEEAQPERIPYDPTVMEQLQARV
jgi:hypothetical protein